jgi:hypothetical protein
MSGGRTGWVVFAVVLWRWLRALSGGVLRVVNHGERTWEGEFSFALGWLGLVLVFRFVCACA